MGVGNDDQSHVSLLEKNVGFEMDWSRDSGNWSHPVISGPTGKEVMVDWQTCACAEDILADECGVCGGDNYDLDGDYLPEGPDVDCDGVCFGTAYDCDGESCGMYALDCNNECELMGSNEFEFIDELPTCVEYEEGLILVSQFNQLPDPISEIEVTTITATMTDTSGYCVADNTEIIFESWEVEAIGLVVSVHVCRGVPSLVALLFAEVVLEPGKIENVDFWGFKEFGFILFLSDHRIPGIWPLL